MNSSSLAHTKWKCQYHIVFIPKYRRKVLLGQLKADMREIIKKLCEYKRIEIVEGAVCSDHVHLCVSLPPKYSVQQAPSEPTEQLKEAVDSFWDHNTVNSTKENNILSFRTGMQIVLPKAWDGEIVTSVGDGTLTVADKRNVEKGAGGVMFYLTYFDRKGATARRTEKAL